MHAAVDGGKIRRLRQARKWSVEDLVFEARKRGYSLGAQTVILTETGKRPALRASTLKAISDTLGVPMDDLMSELEEATI